MKGKKYLLLHKDQEVHLSRPEGVPTNLTSGNSEKTKGESPARQISVSFPIKEPPLCPEDRGHGGTICGGNYITEHKKKKKKKRKIKKKKRF